MASPSLPPSSSLKFLKALRRVRAAIVAPPPGFLTTAQWAKKWDMPIQGASILLREGLKKGIVEVKRLRTELANGTSRPVPYYAAK